MLRKNVNMPSRIAEIVMQPLLAFFQEFFAGCKIYCYANFSIVFGPNVMGGKSLRRELLQGAPHVPSPVDESQPLRFPLSSKIYFIDLPALKLSYVFDSF